MPLSSVPAFLNLILGYEYYKPVNRKPHVKAPFMPSSAPSARHITIPTDPKPVGHIKCGTCDESAAKHPITEYYETPFSVESEVICDRTFDVPEDFSYGTLDKEWDERTKGGFMPAITPTVTQVSDYDVVSGEALTDLDYSNAYLERGFDLDAYDGEYEGHDNIWTFIDNYRDVHDKEYTSALNCWTFHADKWGGPPRRRQYIYKPDSAQAIGNLPGRYLDAGQSKNIYFVHEDNHQGITVQAYDPHLTELYAHRLLNFYVDKRTGDLRLGGLRLSKDSATCVRNTCKAHLVKPDTEDRNEQEQYVLDLIRHGNNHAANFLVSRSDWYKVHTDFCDLNCDRNAAHCGTIDEVVARSLELLRSTLNTSPLKVA